jgi:glycosidase
MPGVPYIWYGDEIGMRSFDLPSKEGGYQRTGARTPMQWSGAQNAGFSSARPETLYLPVDPSPDRPNVQQQDNDPHSLLNRVRQLVAIRKAHPALQASAPFELLYALPGKYPLVYRRNGSDGTYIIAINPSDRAVDAEIPFNASSDVETLYGTPNAVNYQHAAYNVRLPGISGGIYRLVNF